MTPDLERYDPPDYIERLEAENAEMRRALRRIASMHENMGATGSTFGLVGSMAATARAALR